MTIAAEVPDRVEPARIGHVDGRDALIASGLLLSAGATLRFTSLHTGLACPLRTITGIPCPLCGMTTSVTATVGGDLAAAAAATPAGIVAVAVALYVVVVRPRRIPAPPIAVVTALTAMWLFQLARFSII